jgi:hypothetical protein
MTGEEVLAGATGPCGDVLIYARDIAHIEVLTE